jgi:glycogen synthase
VKARLLLVTRDRYRLPLLASQRRKLNALGDEFELRVLASAADRHRNGDQRFELGRRQPVLDGPLFYAALPARAARTLRAYRPDAVLVQGTHETAAVLLARSLARLPVPVILDLHGDWRAATRLYGSPLRRVLDPVGDAVSRVAVLRADAVRTISDFTTGLVRDLGRDATAVFPAYVDRESFFEPPPVPLPERPTVLFVGVLERYKNFDGLVAAWRSAAERVPDASLRIVGDGHQAAFARQLVAELPANTTYTPTLAPTEVARALDEAWALVLPSRSEGLPRVVIEAFCRGRMVVGSRAGGIPDIVEHERNGLLVDGDDPRALADALVRVLRERELAERLGAQARTDASRWVSTPEEFAGRVRDLVDRTRGARLPGGTGHELARRPATRSGTGPQHIEPAPELERDLAHTIGGASSAPASSSLPAF